jgi:peptide/nickel transport system substrate-binding protein
MLKQLSTLAAIVALAAMPLASSAQSKKDSVVMGMGLEPPGLDPTTAAAAAIAEVTLYNVYETLTKINEDGSVAPLLARSWDVAPDLKTYTFKLLSGVTFQNGEPFNAAAVKFSYDRAGAPTSTNKDKSLFQSMAAVTMPDADTVVITMKNPQPNLPFLLGQATASIVEPNSAPTDATQPVGTGPFVLAAWAKGSSITLNKWPGYRNAPATLLNKVTMRFISDASAQVASLLSGDVDAFPRVTAARSLAQFKSDPRFVVLIGGSKAKTIVAINNKKKPFDDVRVRRAILAAIDRKAMIEGAVDGFGVPIGSFYTPGSPGYVDTTDITRR